MLFGLPRLVPDCLYQYRMYRVPQIDLKMMLEIHIQIPTGYKVYVRSRNVPQTKY